MIVIIIHHDHYDHNDHHDHHDHHDHPLIIPLSSYNQMAVNGRRQWSSMVVNGRQLFGRRSKTAFKMKDT